MARSLPSLGALGALGPLAPGGDAFDAGWVGFLDNAGGVGSASAPADVMSCLERAATWDQRAMAVLSLCSTGAPILKRLISHDLLVRIRQWLKEGLEQSVREPVIESTRETVVQILELLVKAPRDIDKIRDSKVGHYIKVIKSGESPSLIARDRDLIAKAEVIYSTWADAVTAKLAGRKEAEAAAAKPADGGGTWATAAHGAGAAARAGSNDAGASSRSKRAAPAEEGGEERAKRSKTGVDKSAPSKDRATAARPAPLPDSGNSIFSVPLPSFGSLVLPPMPLTLPPGGAFTLPPPLGGGPPAGPFPAGLDALSFSMDVDGATVTGTMPSPASLFASLSEDALGEAVLWGALDEGEYEAGLAAGHAVPPSYGAETEGSGEVGLSEEEVGALLFVRGLGLPERYGGAKGGILVNRVRGTVGGVPVSDAAAAAAAAAASVVVAAPTSPGAPPTLPKPDEAATAAALARRREVRASRRAGGGLRWSDEGAEGAPASGGKPWAHPTASAPDELDKERLVAVKYFYKSEIPAKISNSSAQPVPSKYRPAVGAAAAGGGGGGGEGGDVEEVVAAGGGEGVAAGSFAAALSRERQSEHDTQVKNLLSKGRAPGGAPTAPLARPYTKVSVFPAAPAPAPWRRYAVWAGAGAPPPVALLPGARVRGVATSTPESARLEGVSRSCMRVQYPAFDLIPPNPEGPAGGLEPPAPIPTRVYTPVPSPFLPRPAQIPPQAGAAAGVGAPLGVGFPAGLPRRLPGQGPPSADPQAMAQVALAMNAGLMARAGQAGMGMPQQAMGMGMGMGMQQMQQQQMGMGMGMQQMQPQGMGMQQPQAMGLQGMGMLQMQPQGMGMQQMQPQGMGMQQMQGGLAGGMQSMVSGGMQQRSAVYAQQPGQQQMSGVQQQTIQQLPQGLGMGGFQQKPQTQGMGQMAFQQQPQLMGGMQQPQAQQMGMGGGFQQQSHHQLGLGGVQQQMGGMQALGQQQPQPQQAGMGYVGQQQPQMGVYGQVQQVLGMQQQPMNSFQQQPQYGAGMAAPQQAGGTAGCLPTVGLSRGSTKRCAFFNSRNGCRNGSTCQFVHDPSYVQSGGWPGQIVGSGAR